MYNQIPLMISSKTIIDFRIKKADVLRLLNCEHSRGYGRAFVTFLLKMCEEINLHMSLKSYEKLYE